MAFEYKVFFCHPICFVSKFLSLKILLRKMNFFENRFRFQSDTLYEITKIIQICHLNGPNRKLKIFDIQLTEKLKKLQKFIVFPLDLHHKKFQNFRSIACVEKLESVAILFSLWNV